LHRLYPDQYRPEKLDRLMVSKSSLDALIQGEDPRRIEEDWRDATEKFQVLRAKYLLY
jgi:hypothetical protein